MNATLVLVGNTCIKTYLLDETMQIIKDTRFFHHEIANCAASLQNETYIASVAPNITSLLTSHAPTQPIIMKNTDMPIITNFTKVPEQTGIDRLLNALAAYQASPAQNNIIVDCGTAISISVVTSKAEFLGGAILAGIHTELKALNQNTELLPDLSNSEITSFQIGTDTESALNSGVCWGKIGAIKELVQLTKTELSKINSLPAKITITGGWGKAISEHLPIPHKYEPLLTCLGMIETIKTLKRHPSC